MIPTTQTLTASGLTSQMWNLETISSRFVENSRWHLASSWDTAIWKELHFSGITLRALHVLFSFVFAAVLFDLCCFSTDQCKSVLSGPRVRLQQQHSALWCSLHWQLCLLVRLSHVRVSMMWIWQYQTFLVSSIDNLSWFYSLFLAIKRRKTLTTIQQRQFVNDNEEDCIWRHITHCEICFKLLEIHFIS